MSKMKPMPEAIIRALTELLIIFPIIFIIGRSLMGSPMAYIFTAELIVFALLGVFTRKLIPIPWLQLAVGVPVCFAIAILFGKIFDTGNNATYMIPLILAPFVFYRGKQHAGSPWNEILPTFVPCFILVIDFFVMVLANVTNSFETSRITVTIIGPFSLVAALIVMSNINLKNLSEDLDFYKAGSTLTVSKGLGTQNNRMLAILIVVGLILSTGSVLITIAKYLMSALKTFILWLIDVLFSIQILNEIVEDTAPDPAEGLLEELEGAANSHAMLEMIANILLVLVSLVLLYIVIVAIIKGVKLLLEILKRMSDQGSGGGFSGTGFDDTRESIIDLRDLPRKYLNNIRQRLSDMMRREKKWNELKTPSERVKYLYRRSLNRAAATGYQHEKSYTAREALNEAAESLPQIAPARGELALDYDIVRYAEREPDKAEVDALKDKIGL